MRSMTGYGSGRAALGGGHVVLDVRAVNHRFLDIRVRLPSLIQSKTPAVERILRARLERGRVDVTGRLEGQTLPQPTLDRERARAIYRELAALRDEIDATQPLPLSLLSVAPDLFVATRELDDETVEQAVGQATDTACSAVIAMRNLEGETLAAELGRRLAEVETTLATLHAALPALVDSRRARLRDRIEGLLGDTSMSLDPGRLEQEIAILADRSDVTEELVRLRSHLGQMLELTENSREPVGKRIDFLLQEMSREAHTIGSKLQDGTVTPHVIALKAGIEQMREQAHNVL